MKRKFSRNWHPSSTLKRIEGEETKKGRTIRTGQKRSKSKRNNNLSRVKSSRYHLVVLMEIRNLVSKACLRIRKKDSSLSKSLCTALRIWTKGKRKARRKKALFIRQTGILDHTDKLLPPTNCKTLRIRVRQEGHKWLKSCRDSFLSQTTIYSIPTN